MFDTVFSGHHIKGEFMTAQLNSECYQILLCFPMGTINHRAASLLCKNAQSTQVQNNEQEKYMHLSYHDNQTSPLCSYSWYQVAVTPHRTKSRCNGEASTTDASLCGKFM